MHFQLSTILSLSILAVSTMASPQFLPGPGVTLSFADGTTEHFPFDTCIPSAEDGLGSTVTFATFSEAVICTLFNQADCDGTVSVPVPFPPIVPVPNPFVAGFIVNSATCSSV
ncbi:hypothetical protein M422DRAFT_255010 [Sphaerobolus stellatus SS14]|uniref:Ubiquitin 3 binding protein But2 C-terminal domain-containing protein n=1 Tax=Sphaerobolus stellatus (strain SS14) TaxID=990650 RepID=A0A0C9V558_SPHS4|nr:hypothetical protein M422DRAFT_255010 [Sphaerobolus stellatus SS14]